MRVTGEFKYDNQYNSKYNYQKPHNVGLKNKIDDYDLSFNRLTQERMENVDSNFMHSNIEYVDEMLNGELYDTEPFEKTEKTKEAMIKLNMDIKYFEKPTTRNGMLKKSSICTMSKEELEYCIYEEDLSLEQLLKIKSCMKKYNFSKSDIEYVDELINENLEGIDSLEKMEKIKETMKRLNMDVKYIDRLIERKKPLKASSIDTMDKEDLEYYIYEEDLSLEQLLKIKLNMKKYNFSKSDFEYVDEMINEQKEYDN